MIGDVAPNSVIAAEEFAQLLRRCELALSQQVLDFLQPPSDLPMRIAFVQ